MVPFLRFENVIKVGVCVATIERFYSQVFVVIIDRRIFPLNILCPIPLHMNGHMLLFPAHHRRGRGAVYHGGQQQPEDRACVLSIGSVTCPTDTNAASINT